MSYDFGLVSYATQDDILTFGRVAVWRLSQLQACTSSNRAL